MLAFFLSLAYLFVCLLYIGVLLVRNAFRLDNGHLWGMVLLFVYTIGTSFLFYLLFGVLWVWAAKNNQVGEHSWAIVAYIVIFTGTLWLIRQILYVSPRKRWSHRHHLSRSG